MHIKWLKLLQQLLAHKHLDVIHCYFSLIINIIIHGQACLSSRIFHWCDSMPTKTGDLIQHTGLMIQLSLPSSLLSAFCPVGMGCC